MKSIIYLIAMVFAGLLVGCGASIPPTELVNARQAYQHASISQAAQLVPAELHKAQAALAIAEKSFQDDPKSFKTRDLAYIADRKAKMAEALAITAAENATAAKANKDYQSTQTEIVKSAKEDLAASERNAALKTEQLAAEQKARADADKRTADAQAALAKLAAVKEEARGLVITLSGSVLFASGKSALLPAAQDRLNQVAAALLETKERKLVVEGHTDSQGSNSSNQVLSQKRADAVRSYLISRGYPGDLIQAQGIGEDRPIADNANAEGRANNRRVEIVVDRSAK
ncbi:MAG: OmpA family protein [Ignavibacteriaceae bacterium]|jgi:outer membrane protein OmpA-like peptidoglycan-associated protein